MEKLLLRPRECVELTGLGRSFVYELIRRGEIPSVRIHRAVRVPTAQLLAWIEGLPIRQEGQAVTQEAPPQPEPPVGHDD